MANEKRLIDANALEARMGNLCDEFGTDHLFIDAIVYEIGNAPTVDAVEVKRGHWFSLTDCSNAGVYCSACHKKVWKEDYAWCNRKNRLRSNYCPNCGADMRGSEE